MSQTSLEGVGGAPPGRSGSAAPHGVPPASTKRLGSYLRRLREGYGYTLRKVEERAHSIGESIDNSQLSRFEKGKAVPSFEKLRALARIFNVSVQNFSDILDLEEFARLKPEGADYDTLIRRGGEDFARGEYGKAFVTFERALEVAEGAARGDAEGDDPREPYDRSERVAGARGRMAKCLRAMGKLSLTEAELRTIMRHRKRLSAETQMKCLIELSHVYRQLSDLYLATVFARECLGLARQDGDVKTQIAVLNNLGSIQHDEGDAGRAREFYEEALDLLGNYDGNPRIRSTLVCNLGGCLVSLGEFDAGLGRLREAYSLARAHGFRRQAALALNRIAEAGFLRGDHESARRYSLESDNLASSRSDTYHDILFMNAYLRWQVAREEGKGTQEKIAFGRLRHLRSLIERTFPEVLEFDQFVERTRRNHA